MTLNEDYSNNDQKVTQVDKLIVTCGFVPVARRLRCSSSLPPQEGATAPNSTKRRQAGGLNKANTVILPLHHSWSPGVLNNSQCTC